MYLSCIRRNTPLFSRQKAVTWGLGVFWNPAYNIRCVCRVDYICLPLSVGSIKGSHCWADSPIATSVFCTELMQDLLQDIMRLTEASPNMRSTDIIYCHILSLSILVLKLIKCCKSFQIAHTNLTNSIVHWYWALWNANCYITTEHHSGVILECCEFNFFIFSTCIVKPVHKWIISTKCKQIKVDIDIFIHHNQNLWFDSLDPFLWGCNFGLQIF